MSDWEFSQEDLLDNKFNNSIDSIEMQYHDAYAEFGFDSDIESLNSPTKHTFKSLPRKQSTPWKARHRPLMPLYHLCML